MLDFIHSLFERIKEHEPIADGIVLTGRDRDNWFVSFGDKKTRVYAPAATLFSRRKLDFHGVISERWDSPHENIYITKDEKDRVEQALIKHLTDKGIICAISHDKD